MKILYSTDLHGDKNKYEKMLELARKNQIDIMVNGGDMLPKRCDRPIVQPAFINGYLDDYFKRVNESGIRYLVMLGNDDLESMDDLFDAVCSKYPNIYNIADTKITIDGYDFIGVNKILDTPYACKDRIVYENRFVDEPQIDPISYYSTELGFKEIKNWDDYRNTSLPLMETILEDLPKPENFQKAVYVVHMPPAGQNLGQLYRINRDVGSWDLTDFIEKTQPLLTLHGHIHESPEMTGKWREKIGQTDCLQPGQTEMGMDEMVYAILDLDNKIYRRETVKVLDNKPC